MTLATLEAKTVAELHAIARELGLPTTERRRDLVARILDAHAPGAGGMRASLAERPAYMRGYDPRAVTLDGLVRKSGVLEVLPDGYGFLRSPDYGYQPSPDDVYVSPSQIKRFGLHVGDTVDGQLRPPKEGDRFFALLRVHAINGRPPDTAPDRTRFDFLTPAYPDAPLRLETTADAVAARVVDLVAPIGKGQRGFIVAPPRAGRTTLLQAMAEAVAANEPQATLLLLFVDERPDEVARAERALPGAEVIATPPDEAPERQVHVADLVLEKARRLVEAGHDVVLLVDSATTLARAHQAMADTDADVLAPAARRALQRFVGAARAVEEGGSLTVLATLVTETGHPTDAALAEAFAGTGNVELVLRRDLADAGCYPALDVAASGARREELFVAPERLVRLRALRERLAPMTPPEALAFLTERCAATPGNDALLATFAA